MGCAAATARRRRRQAVLDKRYKSHTKEVYERREATANERRRLINARKSRKRY